ncbi:TPA: hypothetical protein F8R85_16865 [Legionella pneumophila]|nr:hypothetical protein [Legionella pneumophila]HAU1500694.1 hypothetical protein [Legionella pneumophila]HAU1519538.1 hypothetical protein [Legionella pneumophila]
MTEVYEEIKNKLSVEDHQKAVLFQFMTLYERWSEDRQVSAKQGYDLANRLEQFSKEVDRFSSIEEAVIVKLRKSLNEATLALSGQVNTATAEALNTTLGSSIARIEKTSKTVETILASNQQIRWLSQLKTLTLNVLCSLLVSGLVLWFFMPQPTLPLTEEDMNTYVIGKRFARIWPTLSKEKQQWFLSQGKEKRGK